jgi:hypothetical protein
MSKIKLFIKHKTALFFLFFSLLTFSAFSQQNSSTSKEYFTIESYYRVKWGHADEFVNLWKQNHYPLLKKALEKGDVISITASEPKFHAGEDTRWDFRVAVVFKTVALAFDENLVEPYKKLLFPDLDALKKSEQYRFELLLAHWDVETGNDVLP